MNIFNITKESAARHGDDKGVIICIIGSVLIFLAVITASVLYVYPLQRSCERRQRFLAEITKEIIQAEADTLCKQENICVNIRRPSADGNQECILKTIKLIRPFMNSDTAFASGKSKKFYALYCRAVCRNDIAGILCQGADEQIIFKNFLRKNDIGTVLLQRLLWVERNKDGGNYNNNAKEKFNCAVHNIFTAGQCGAPHMYSYLIAPYGGRDFLNKSALCKFIPIYAAKESRRIINGKDGCDAEFIYFNDNCSANLYAAYGTGANAFTQVLLLCFTCAVLVIIFLLAFAVFFLKKSCADKRKLKKQEEAIIRLKQAAEEANAANKAKALFVLHVA